MMMHRAFRAHRQLGRACAAASTASRTTTTPRLPPTASSRLWESAKQPVSIRCFSDLPVKTSKDGVVGAPIDFDVNSKVEGNESQVRVAEFVGPRKNLLKQHF
jgi:hypothetical protein